MLTLDDDSSIEGEDDAHLELDPGEDHVDPPVHEPGERDYDAEARAQGWKPLAEFRGDPAQWVDAKTYITRGEAQMPVLRETVRRMTEKNRRLENQVSGLNQKLDKQSADIQALVEIGKAARKQGYDAALKDLETRKREAIRTGDEAQYDQVAAEIRAVEADRAATEKPAAATPPAGAAPPLDPAVTAFIEANPWFKTDQELANEMIVQERALSIRQDLTMAQRLAEAKKRVAAIYPEKFPRRAAAPAPTPEPDPEYEEDDFMADEPPAPAPAPAQRRPAMSLAPRTAASAPAARTRTDPFEQIPAGERAEARKAWQSLKVHDPDYSAAEYVDGYLNPHADALALRRKHRGKK